MNKTLHIQVILYNSLDWVGLLLKSIKLCKKTDWSVFLHFVSHDENNLQEYKKIIDNKLKSSGINYTLEKNKNVGFGPGHNFLFKKYKKEYQDFFLILNPDLIFFNDFFEKLDQTLEKLRDFGLIACEPFPLSQPEYYNPKTWEINWGAGTALIINVQKFIDVGMFDENIFMYYEDVDLSWRFKLKNYKVYYSPICKLGHIGAASSKIKFNTLNVFNSINMLAGEAYLSKKYKLRNDKQIIKKFKSFPEFGNKSLEKYKKMIKNLPKVKKASFTSFKSLSNKRWEF